MFSLKFDDREVSSFHCAKSAPVDFYDCQGNRIRNSANKATVKKSMVTYVERRAGETLNCAMKRVHSPLNRGGCGLDANLAPPFQHSLASSKACNESYEEQLPDFDSWALTAGILLNKVLFFRNKRTRL